MMRDYKFRVRGHGFRRQPNRRSRRALRLGFLALAAGVSYTIVQVAVSNAPATLTAPSPEGSEVIELPLPPGPLQDEAQSHPPTLGQRSQSPSTAPQENSSPNTAQALSVPLSISPYNNSDPEFQLADPLQELAGLTPALPDLFGMSQEELLELSLSNTPTLALQIDTLALGDAAGEGGDQHTGEQSKTPPALRQGPFRLDYEVQPGDTLGTILESQGLPGRMVYQILDQVSKTHRRRLEQIRPGETIRLHFDQALELERLEFKLSATERLMVSHDGDTVTTSVNSAAIEPRRQCLTAVVKHSLYGAAKSAGIPDQVTQRAINIFRHQINFARQTREGDKLSVLFEQIYAGDEPIKTGPVLAVEFTNANKQYAAVRYTTSKGVTDYFTADGQPVDKGRYSFLRTPLNYTRVSSGFTLARMHPVLRRIRPHTGVDFAAPAGRRVLAAADGRVHFKGRKGGYGNIVILRHGSKYETRYAHLMRFAKGLSSGGRVTRGDTIGYVGQTGLATGPHLHYEIRIDGSPVNPLTAKLPFLNEFDDSEKARFRRQTKPLMAELQRTREPALLVDARDPDSPESSGFH
jgi:murein DD-endopeptidase MepM/ murein hydrolase activator NlpD